MPTQAFERLPVGLGAVHAGQGAIIPSHASVRAHQRPAHLTVPADPNQGSLDVTLRDVMRGVAASVVLVTTGSPAGDRHAMTASSFTSVSLDPPTILVCIHGQASICAPVLARRRFVINVLGAGQDGVARLCSGSRAADRFADTDWRFDEAGLPYLASAQAVLFCETEQSLDAGTHHVLLGRVVQATTSGRADPLIYLDGGFLAGAMERSPKI